MEHNEMDKLFRKIIHNDNSELNEAERNSKINIWNQLDVPSRKKIFPIWKIAAAILFFLWGGTTWFFSKKINQEKQVVTQLQSNYDEVKNALSEMQTQLDKNMALAKNQKTSPIQSKEKNEISSGPIIQKEVIEKIVLVRDTVFIRQNIAPQKLVQVVKDTVFIEVPVQAPFKMTEFKNQKELPNEKKTKQKTPSKIEFVFGKKPLKKQTQQNKFIIINENEVAKKTKKSNSSLITIPIKN